MKSKLAFLLLVVCGAVRSAEPPKWSQYERWSVSKPVAATATTQAKYWFTKSGGRFYVTIKGPDGVPMYVEVTVTIDDLDAPGPAPIPVPIPPPVPTPTPVPPVVPPGPTPPPVTTGARRIAIVSETDSETATFGRMKVMLRTGVSDQYLKLKNHELLILDPNAKDQNDQPSPVLAPWLKVINEAMLKLPAIVIADKVSGVVYYRGELPPDATADQVIELIKRHGG